MKNMPDTFSIDYACLQISPFETVIYNVSGPFLEIKSVNMHKKTFCLNPSCVCARCALWYESVR